MTQLQDQSAQAAKRLTEAQTAQKLEERQQSERFALLERAVSPDYPVTGGRKKLAIVGALASVIAGIVAAFAMDLMHPVLRTRTQFERTLGLRPVVVIPELPLSQRPRRKSGGAALARRAMGSLRDGVSRVVSGGDAVLVGLPRQTLLGAGAALILTLMVLAIF